MSGRRRGCLDPVWVIYAGIWAVLILLFVFTACTRKEQVTVERVVVRTDTLREVVELRDTSHVRDSVFLTERVLGDTVFRELYKERVVYRERWRTDTLSRVRLDSVRVPAPYPVVREVRKPLRWWEAALVWTGAGFLVAVGIWIMLKLRSIC